MKQNTKQSYFVTGGAGFIGSHLVETLVSEGYRVTVYDNLCSGKKQNIERHIGKPNFNFVQADILNLPVLQEKMKGHDVVWHLAANTDIPTGNRVTDLDLNNCTVGTRNVLEAMRLNKISEILFASSATVYGDTPPIALSESMGPLLPISLYGAGKLACEGLISAYSHLYGIRACMFRFGNVVGGNMAHGVIFDFIHKLRKNPKELEILGDGKQEKNFFMVEDCIAGMRWAFQKSSKPYDVFNLGCESSVTVKEIGRIVAEEMGLKDVKQVFTGGARGWPGDAPYVRFDVNKMKQLGWVSSHTSPEAVRIAAQRLIKTT
ncbi:MAG: NAD-dependent epimerase/dehydratase family protein [Dehalococcoidales bacterium]|nr:NAD-dependent epimerase/dehydratase family protein [Dehalococcoidales bacterium]